VAFQFSKCIKITSIHVSSMYTHIIKSYNYNIIIIEHCTTDFRFIPKPYHELLMFVLLFNHHSIINNINYQQLYGIIHSNVNRDFTRNPKYHKIHQNVAKQTNQGHVAWWAFNATRRLITEPINLSQSGCVAWRAFIAVKRFLGRSS